MLMNISENILESSTISCTENPGINALLLGGAGFLGTGLSRELAKRGYEFKILDKSDMDLSDVSNI